MKFALMTWGDEKLGSYATLDETYRVIVDRRIEKWRIFLGEELMMVSQRSYIL